MTHEPPMPPTEVDGLALRPAMMAFWRQWWDAKARERASSLNAADLTPELCTLVARWARSRSPSDAVRCAIDMVRKRDTKGGSRKQTRKAEKGRPIEKLVDWLEPAVAEVMDQSASYARELSGQFGSKLVLANPPEVTDLPADEWLRVFLDAVAERIAEGTRNRGD